MTTTIRLLTADDAADFQRLRLHGLRECPTAFASYESLGFIAWGTEPAAAWDELGAHDETWMVCPLRGR